MPDAEDAPEGFEWDVEKAAANLEKHGVDFHQATRVWEDPKVMFLQDEAHSEAEERLFAVGLSDGEVLTVRFTYRDGRKRIIGAGAWRKGRRQYAGR